MIGLFDYTVILTYMSLASGVTGILISLSGFGHPYVGVFFLLFSGLCDAFDGKVARSKAGRSQFEKNFGQQIDSLADLVSFGVLPACIGMAMIKANSKYLEIPVINEETNRRAWYAIILMLIAAVYVLAALIRLAYFNATDMEREKEEQQEGYYSYTGLPVTSAALVFPFVLLLHFFTRFDFSILYFAVMLLMSALFLGNFKIKKIGGWKLGVLIGIGVIEFFMIIFRCWRILRGWP